MDVDDEVRGNTRRRIFSVLNKTRRDFPATPAYEDFTEAREDLILRFLELHAAQTLPEAAGLREELNRELAAYERENEEQILAARSIEDERKKDRIKEVVRQEGLFFERVNADYAHRDKVLSHPLEAQYSNLLAASPEPARLSSAPKDRRRTRLIPSQAPEQVSAADSIASTLEAAGVVGLWKQRALDSVVKALQQIKI